MKALTLWEPWATLVAYGYKKFETRSWSTNYRGLLVIHAAKRPPTEVELESEFVNSALGKIGLKDFSLGCALCIVELVNVRTTESALASGLIGPAEFKFGDYSAGRYAWQLAQPIRYTKPVPMIGRHGVWTLTGADIIALVNQRRDEKIARMKKDTEIQQRLRGIER